MANISSSWHISVATIALILSIASAQGLAINVSQGECIQAAIDTAHPGDIIEVYSGTYRENLDITKQLIIKGKDTGDGLPEVEAGSKGSAINISADGVELEGFRITNPGRLPDDAGINISSNHIVVKNNIIEGNGSDNGVNLFRSTNTTVANNTIDSVEFGVRLIGSDKNTILDNKFPLNDNGIVLDDSNNNSLTANDVSNNYNGIYLNHSNGNTLSGNRASNNEQGIKLFNSDNNSLTINNASYNFDGIELDNSSYNNLSNNYVAFNQNNIILMISNGNILIKNDVISDDLNGFSLYSSHNNVIANNNASYNYEGVYLSASNDNILISNNLSNNNNAIRLDYSNGNALINNIASNSNLAHNNYGIRLESSSNNTLTDNNLSNNEYGITLALSSGNRLSNNSMFGNRYNFQMDGSIVSDFDNAIDATNLVNGRPIYYLKDASNETIDSTSNAGLVGCFNCTNITVRNLNISDSGIGIVFVNTYSSKVMKNYLRSLQKGIQLLFSSNNTLEDNNISDNYYGIKLDNSNENNISANNVSFNTYGFNLDSSEDNVLLNNDAISNERKGFSLDSSNNNSLWSNFARNSKYGLGLESSSNNTLTDNNLSNNEYGIALALSSGNRLSNNSMFGNRYNFQMDGNIVSDFDNAIDATNLVNGRPIYYLKDASNETIDSMSNAGLVGCFNCTNITINGLSIADAGSGISLIKTNYSLVELNNLTDLGYGVYLRLSNNNSLRFNNVRNSSYGIYIALSNNNSIENNSLSNVAEVPIGYHRSRNNKFAYNSENETEIFLEEWDIPGYSTPSLIASMLPEPAWLPARDGIPENGVEINGHADESTAASRMPQRSSGEKGSEEDGLGIAEPQAIRPTTSTEEHKKRIREEIERLPWGQIVFTPPGKMWKGVSEVIVVRISQDLFENISRGLEEYEKIERKEIRTSYEMGAELHGYDDFEVMPKGQVSQSLPSEGYAEWYWTVTPLNEGNQTLKLTVYATIKLPSDEESVQQVKVLEKDILVEVDWAHEVGNTVLGGGKWIILLFVTALATGIINWLSGGILNRIKSLGKVSDEYSEDGKDDEKDG